MEKTTFELTLNLQDLRELFANDLYYKLFNRENRIIIAILFITFFLMIYFLVISDEIDRHFIYSMIFLSLFVYSGRSFYLHYRKFRNKADLLEQWIQSLAVYMSHRLEFDEMSLIYFRDDEKFVYDLNTIESALRNESSFFLRTTDDYSIILPKKAFKEGDFEHFLECFYSRVNQQKAE